MTAYLDSEEDLTVKVICCSLSSEVDEAVLSAMAVWCGERTSKDEVVSKGKRGGKFDG